MTNTNINLRKKSNKKQLNNLIKNVGLYHINFLFF